MSTIVWERRITKGNSTGTGWLYMPKELESSLELGSNYNLFLYEKEIGQLEVLVKLVEWKGYWGFYIPKTICEKHNLIRKKVEVVIEESEYFPAQISADKRVYLPHSYIISNGISENELYEIEIVANGLVFGEVVIISKRDRSKEPRPDEYAFTLRLCAIPKKVRAKVKFIRKIKLLSPVKSPLPEEYFYLPSLFHGAIMGKIDPNEMIIFKGNHVPIITPITIKLEEYIHYFGCYYADGTKTGWGWSTSASTPEQAIYYIEKYYKLVFNDILDFVLTYSQKPSDERTECKVKLDLQKYWKHEANIDIKTKKIRVLKAKTDNPLKWNACGSVRICSYKTQVLDLHMGLLGEIVFSLKSCKNKEHLWQFLFGILEGDGSVSGGKGRLGVCFSCHNDDEIIRHSLKQLGVQFSVDLSRVKKGIGFGIAVSFWQIEVLNNLEIISNNIFQYYPKRRKTFIERLLYQSSVKKLLRTDNPIYTRTSHTGHKYDLDANNLRTLLSKLAVEFAHTKITQ